MRGRLPDDPLKEIRSEINERVFDLYSIWSTHKIMGIEMVVAEHFQFRRGCQFWAQIEAYVTFEYLGNNEIKEHKITCARLDKRKVNE